MGRAAEDVRSRWFTEGRVPMRTRLVHGYRRSFLVAGDGPLPLLIHGIGDSSQSWRDVIPMLARNHLVIAPDLLGHGASDKPRADYSVTAYANGMRDLFSVLGIDKVTLVGHSLGGGVAVQFRLSVSGAHRTPRARRCRWRRPQRLSPAARRVAARRAPRSRRAHAWPAVWSGVPWTCCGASTPARASTRPT